MASPKKKPKFEIILEKLQGMIAAGAPPGEIRKELSKLTFCAGGGVKSERRALAFWLQAVHYAAFDEFAKAEIRFERAAGLTERESFRRECLLYAARLKYSRRDDLGQALRLARKVQNLGSGDGENLVVQASQLAMNIRIAQNRPGTQLHPELEVTAEFFKPLEGRPPHEVA